VSNSIIEKEKKTKKFCWLTTWTCLHPNIKSPLDPDRRNGHISLSNILSKSFDSFENSSNFKFRVFSMLVVLLRTLCSELRAGKSDLKVRSLQLNSTNVYCRR